MTDFDSVPISKTFHNSLERPIMNLKSTIILTLLLAIAAVPAIADDQMTPETIRGALLQHENTGAKKSTGTHLDNTPSTPTPVRQEVSHLPESDELLSFPALIEASATTQILSCNAVEGTPCTDSCPPCDTGHPWCPNPSPCFCVRGSCHCDIDAP